MRNLIFILMLSGCANWQYAGLNYAEVTGSNGEHWIIASGKDQTNTKLNIERDVNGNVVAIYSSEKEDATAALKAAFDSLSNTIAKLTEFITSLRPAP
jgi:hypothetical protein